MKKKDWIFIASLCIFIVVSYVLFMQFQVHKKSKAIEKENIVEVHYKDEIIDEIDITVNKTYTYKGDYGKFSVEVKDRKYHAINVDCPNHDCENMGWIKQGNPLPILCIPNQIFVVQAEISDY